MNFKLKKKTISIFLSLILIFNLAMQVFTMSVVNAQSFEYSACYPDSASGTVKFIVKYNDGGINPTNAYVVGDFNNWTYDSKYLLTWQQDPNDNTWKMMGRFSVSPGTHQYKFRIHYGAGNNSDNDAWIDPNGGNGANGIFKIEALTEGMKITASRNQVARGQSISLVSDLYHVDGNIEELNPTYSIEPRVAGVSIDGTGKLQVAETVSVGTTINVKATTQDNKIAIKTIKVIDTDPLNTQTKVQYYRYDSSYDGWNIWSWGVLGKSNQFSENTDFGKIAGIENNNKFIVRKSVNGDDWNKQEAEMSIPQNVNEVYVVENDKTVYTDFRQAVNASKPKVTSAIMDSKNQIVAYLTHIPKEGTVFDIYANGQKIEGVTSSINDKQVTFNIPSTFNLNPSMLLEVKPSKMFTSNKVTMRRVLDDYYYSGNDLGASYTNDKINLKVWAPTAANVSVVTYQNNEDAKESGMQTQMIKDENTGVFSVSLDRASFYGKYYMYKLSFYEGSFYSKTTFAVDPYAVAVGLNGDKGALISLDDNETIPNGWKPAEKPTLKNPEDAVIYEMHIRDFTIDNNSGVEENKRGKFLGASEQGTVYTDDNGNKDTLIKTGIDHLKELGINYVHLIPVYDFGSVDESITNDPNNRNWGYDPKNYNAIEGSYSSNPSDPKVRIKEYRQMIQEMHNAGIRVVMDVVYNHMQSTTNMDNIVPGYYFRSDDKGNYTNGSGCGNEVASDRPMIRKFIVDSTKQWSNNYNIDGLRFDLMSLIDIDTMKEVTNSIKSINPTNIVYGEPWGGGASALDSNKQTVKGTQRNNHFGVFNDTLRDAIRGGNNPGNGYVNNNANDDTTGKVQEGLKGSVNTFSSDPEETINYVDVHDNYCLWDQISKSLGQIPDDYRNNIDKTNVLSDSIVKRNLLAQSIIMTAQGIPLTQSGTEFLRTKKGDHNSYKSPDNINEIDWVNKKDYLEVFNYNKGLIKLRNEHPAFRMTTSTDIQSNLDVKKAYYDNRIIVSQLKNNANNDKWKNILVIYNPTDREYNLNDGMTDIINPSGGKWHCVVNETRAGTTVIGEPITQRPIVKPYSMMVLYDEEQVPTNIDWSYLFSDQSKDYMEPMEPSTDEDVTVRFRAKVNDVEESYLHYQDITSIALGDQKVSMTKITDDNFYTSKGYDKTKVEFWEGKIPKGSVTKYYNFEIKNKDKVAWISGGVNAGGDNKGVTDYQPKNSSGGIDYGFMIVPNYKTPDTSKEAVLYQVMVDRFRNGDTKNDRTVLDPAVGSDPYDFTKPSEILNWGDIPKAGYETDKIWNNDFYNGDLAGIGQALPYLKNQLGVTGLYLMPIFESQSNHKYDTENYEYVDKNFGGNNALKALMDKAHGSDMKVILDGVFNHTSTSNPWFKDARANDTSKYKNYYFFGNGEKYVEQGYYAWNEIASLPKLNYSNIELQEYMYSGENSIVKKYLKQPYGIDGWRLDAADDISMGPHEYKSGNPNHKSENLQVWEGVNKAIKGVNPNAYILGEYWGGDTQWFDGKHWDGRMNYSGFQLPYVQNRNSNSWLGNQSLDNNGDSSVADVGKFARNQFKTMPYQSVLNSTNSISTHDRPRFLDWDYTGKGNKAMMELAATLQMTYVGIPMIYYGDEIGMSSQKARTDKTSLDGGNDPYNRGSFEWDSSKWDKDMLNNYRKLIKTRKDHKEAMVYGAFEEIQSHKDNKYVVYARYGNNDRAIVVLNNSNANSSKLITINDVYRYGFKDGDVLKDIVSGNTVTVNEGTVIINSRDMTSSVYVLNNTDSNFEQVTEPELDTTIKDSRIQLNEVQGVTSTITNVNNQLEINVSWNAYTDDNAKNILVRLYDSNNVVCAEKNVNISENSCTFTNIQQGSYRAVVKAKADRAKSDMNGVDDKYMDSIYTITSPKEDIIPPTVNGVKDGRAYANAVTITFNEGSATLNGNTFNSGDKVSAEGSYILVVADASKNSTTINFKIEAPNANVDGDGKVDDSDFILVEKYFSRKIVTLVNKSALDVNMDGIINNIDFVLIRRYFKGVIKTFPRKKL